ncbi:MAG: ATP-binding protein [Pyrinomonadaceae bacterium]
MVQPRILGRINRDEFLGRDAELRQIVQHASPLADARLLTLLAVPDGGASELLRQSYDHLFARRGDPTPFHFAFQRSDATIVDVGRRFFQMFLQQYVAYRRVDPSLCQAPLTLHDLLELALPADYEFINTLIEGFEREQVSSENLITFCFSLPHRFLAEGRRVFPLIDCMGLRPARDDVTLAHRLISSIGRAGIPAAAAGLRRQMTEVIHGLDNVAGEGNLMVRVDSLSDDSARRVVGVVASRYEIEMNEPTRDLIVQQLNRSPVLISQLLQSARETGANLTSFLACQRLYVDDLMGGRLKRYFDRIVDLVAGSPQTRRMLWRLLYESAQSETHKSSLWTWKKRLGVTAPEFERVIDALHIWELVNSSRAFIEVNAESTAWLDYLRVHYAMQVSAEPRARIVGTTLLHTLKRAPQTMARKYQHEAALSLRELVSHFNCQSVPSSLFHYDRFAAAYRGEDREVIESGLESESDLVRLPQIVYTAACSAYSATIQFDSERCAVAHGFEAAEYTDENEIAWLVAEIDSKLEASRELTEEWCTRLSALARENGFTRFRIWLVAREGFSETASDLLNQLEAFGSSHSQIEFLTSRIQSDAASAASSPGADEYEMVIPMGDDSELIAAHAVEQIARRVNFRPEAINQIKTALVEACINATEHSLSPDRKIYQRFVVEDDKLVVTVASRGVVPEQVAGHLDESTIDQSNGASRRGWGLKLIKTLMDEVEFERVDDGTQLKMTKYVR